TARGLHTEPDADAERAGARTRRKRWSGGERCCIAPQALSSGTKSRGLCTAEFGCGTAKLDYGSARARLGRESHERLEWREPRRRAMRHRRTQNSPRGRLTNMHNLS